MILNAEQRAAASAELQKFWSNERRSCPLLAADVDDFIARIDDGIRDMEQAIFQAYPPGDNLDWLLADKATSRHAEVVVARHRVDASGTNPET